MKAVIKGETTTTKKKMDRQYKKINKYLKIQIPKYI